jgi:hypothetical protein
MAIESSHTVNFHPNGRGKAICAPNPDFPTGIDVDVSEGRTSCTIELPYPAPECGSYIVHCKACGIGVAVTAAGRPDDPRSLTIACKIERKKDVL